MRKKYLAIGLIITMLATSAFGCSNSETSDEGETTNNANTADASSTGTKFDIKSETVEENEMTIAVKIDNKLTSSDADFVIESVDSNTIYLNEDSALYNGSGVTIDGGTIKITAGGTYVVTGTLNDGQIMVDSQDKQTVRIVLSNANITSKTNSPIYVVNAKKTIVSAALGTKNLLSDAETYTYASVEDEEPNGCIFSKDDLVISGGGKLTVNGNFNNGIASKDTLEITDIDLTVTAKNNGIKGKDYLIIKDGSITVDSQGDSLKSDNTSDTTLGYILVEGGNIKITSGEDGIQAETCLKITGGEIDIITGKGALVTSANNGWGGGNTTSDTSMKAIKASVDVTITGGDIKINSQDDAIHTNGTVEISGGSFDIASGDDGIHADTELLISGGEINITKSYEGIEATKIIINDGTIILAASDDGINAAGGNDSSAQNGRPGMNNFSSSTGSVEINGGYIYLNAAGDGLDSNGTVTVTGGTILIDGPENDGNGALDYESAFNMTGGLLIAAGSSGMLQTISTSSTQYCIATVLTSYQSAETLFNISDSDGNGIITYSPAKKYNSVVVCSPDIENGKTYSVSTEGKTTGTNNGNGLYADGKYSDGTEFSTVTVSSIVSSIGNAGGMNGGGMPNGGMPNGGMNNGEKPDRVR